MLLYSIVGNPSGSNQYFGSFDNLENCEMSLNNYILKNKSQFQQLTVFIIYSNELNAQLPVLMNIVKVIKPFS